MNFERNIHHKIIKFYAILASGMICKWIIYFLKKLVFEDKNKKKRMILEKKKNYMKDDIRELYNKTKSDVASKVMVQLMF